MNILEFVAHVREVTGQEGTETSNGWDFVCPVPDHDDREPSLGVARGDDGRVLLHCRAGCPTEEVVKALELSLADLFANKDVERHYPYTDRYGHLLFEKVRKPGKVFFQRRPRDPASLPYGATAKDVKDWIVDRQGVRPVLFRWPKVAEAVEARGTVWIAEGEKDVEALELAGVTATCDPGGAEGWLPEFALELQGADVVIVADRDEAGYKHAADVAASLDGRAKSVRVVEAAEGKDAYDHLAAGLGLGDFRDVDLSAHQEANAAGQESYRAQMLDGAAFILDAPPEVVAIWGRGDRIAWAQGESLLVDGPIGVGKGTLLQQVALARLGLRREVLGIPVVPGRRKVLYLAMDRPAQIRRSLARMVTEADRAVLAERLVVWPGPLPEDLAQNPGLLAELAAQADADTVVIDSVKDAAVGLSKDEVGAAYNRARQLALTAGVEVLESHHQRKGQQGAASKPKSIDDVFGSVWIAAGAGSVVLLWGDPGDPVVEWTHLRAPVADVGPFWVEHDHQAGSSKVASTVDLVALAQEKPGGLTARDAAQAIFSIDDPKRAQVEKARRRLDKLAEGDGAPLRKIDGSPIRYVPLIGVDFAAEA